MVNSLITVGVVDTLCLVFYLDSTFVESVINESKLRKKRQNLLRDGTLLG